MYLWQSLLLCFGSLSYIIPYPSPTSHIPDGMAWCSSLLWELILIKSNFAIDNIVRKPLLCFTVGLIQRLRFFHLLFTEHRLFERKISNFDWSVQRTLFHCSIIQSLCDLVLWSLLTLFFFLKSSLLAALLPYRPASRILLFIEDVETFFSRHFFSFAVIFGAVSQLVTDKIIYYSRKTGCI